MAPAGNFLSVLTLHRLGLRAAWVTDLGSDLFSQFVLDAVRRAGLDTRLIRLHDFPLRNISVSFSFTQERGFISFAEDFTEPSPTPVFRQHPARCLLAPSLGLALEHPDLFTLARERGSLIYLDCQFMRCTLETPGVAEALQAADIFAPNASEAMQLTGAAHVEDALARLAELTPLVVVKCGAEGALAQKDGRIFHLPAIPVTVVDTTGAGDCFNAGFVYAYLRGAPLDTCLLYGNICGGISTTARGSQAAPTLEQVEAWLRRIG